MDNWNDFSTYDTGSLERIVRNAIELYGGIDCNFRNKDGDTLLHVAARNGDCNVVKLLLEKGSPFSGKNNQNKTPLDLAEQTVNEITLCIAQHPKRWRTNLS
jgi:ankyrin repeat protein